MPGDFARIEDDGTITLLGRGNTCVNTGGEKVFPEEVEQALKAHPAIHDALVAGAPDERYGQKVAAVVSFRDGMSADTEELSAFLRESLANYKVPKVIVRVMDPARAAWYAEQGLDTICPTSFAIDMFKRAFAEV